MSIEEQQLSEGEILLGQALLSAAVGVQTKASKVASLAYRKAISPGGRPADASSLAKTPEKDNWVDQAGGLPRYIRMVANALVREHGFTTSRAIATAVTRMKVWAATSTNPKVKEAAAAALAEWEAKRGKARASKMATAYIEFMQYKRDRVVRTPEGQRRFGKPIGSVIGGFRFMNDSQMDQQFGSRRRRYTYAPGEHASLHESGDIVLSSGGTGGQYEHDVYHTMNDEQGEHMVNALASAINGASGWNPDNPNEEREIDPETGWIEEYETPSGTRVGFDPVGDIGMVFQNPEGMGRGEDEHHMSNEEARAMANAIHSLVYEHRNGSRPPGDELDEDPEEGYDIEEDDSVVIQNAAQARKFGRPIGSRIHLSEYEKAEYICYKRHFSAEERQAAASSGAALPDGSFPIYTAEDLHNARILLPHAKDRAKASAHIARRAAALGLKSDEPDGIYFPKGRTAGAEKSLRRIVRAPGGSWTRMEVEVS